MKRKPLRFDKYIPAAAAGVFLLLLWELTADFSGISSYLLPAPSVIAGAFVSRISLIGFHALMTVLAAISGLVVSIAVGAVLAVAIDRFSLIKKIIYPSLVVSQTIPVIAIYPLMLLWFGYGIIPKIVVVVLVCFFPLCVNFADGLAGTDKDLINLFRSMNAGRLRTFFWVRFPAALPYFFSGLKIAATYSIIGAVIGEWLGSEYGLGVYMLRSYRAFQTPQVFAAIGAVVIISLLTVGIVMIVERIFVPWHIKKGEMQ
ncbi:MAG: ABC transporter permease [Spirochaetales bacterium]|nr:ABC transporter permease [Spirochaetales bacterium]